MSPNDSLSKHLRLDAEHAKALAHLGIKNGKELPEYATIAAELAAFEQANGPRPENGVSTDT